MMLRLLSKAVTRLNVERQINPRSLVVISCAQNKNIYFPNSGKQSDNYYVQIQSQRFFSTSNIQKEGLVSSLKSKLFSSIGRNTKINIAAVLVYEKLADGLNLKEFLEYFDLPDTFQSWFLVIQLHVWMCTLVTVSEKSGRIFRNRVVDSLWCDVEHRLEELKLEIPKSSERKKYLSEMTDQFQAALISYDEGISSDDTTLAAAVWRTFFCFRNVHPKLLESAVLYIRKQVSHLDSLNSEEVIIKGSISFLPLNSIVKPLSDARNM